MLEPSSHQALLKISLKILVKFRSPASFEGMSSNMSTTRVLLRLGLIRASWRLSHRASQISRLNIFSSDSTTLASLTKLCYPSSIVPTRRLSSTCAQMRTSCPTTTPTQMSTSSTTDQIHLKRNPCLDPLMVWSLHQLWKVDLSIGRIRSPLYWMTILTLSLAW
jgi:hypothetical protein